MALFKEKYIARPEYIKKALPFLDKSLIKIFTGQRRSGKSFMMLQIMDKILEIHPKANIIFIDKELMAFNFIGNALDLSEYLKEQIKPDQFNYLFIDEVQEIIGFEKALRSILNESIADIWCTGSNAQILSGVLADMLSGRFIEIRIHSLSFIEFLNFHSLRNNNDNLFKYLKYGGLPYLINLSLEENIVFDYLKSVNATILLKDIIKRHQIRNVTMLENLIRFLADHTGSLFSAASISKYLKSQSQQISASILSNYIKYILEAFYLCKLQRYDLQGKRILEINEKYYFEDIGLRNAWIGYRPDHINKLIENTVFRHLLEQDYNISIGQLGETEVDFIAEKQGIRSYIQCAYLIPDESTRKREYGNLLKIKDNHRKIVVSLDEPSGGNVEGIEHMHLRRFLSIQI